MDGIHDLGGKHGHGHVRQESSEPAFHARWEAAVFAMVNAAAASGAFKNTDRFRHAIERIDPVAYLSHGYYGRWLGGVETLLVEAGLITTDEISRKALEHGADASDLIAARPGLVPDPQGDPPVNSMSDRSLNRPARYKPGDLVRTATVVQSGHTRLPAYARGKIGQVIDVHGGWVYPDTNAHGRGEQPQHLYTVAFTGSELFPAPIDAADDQPESSQDQNIRVCLDLFEPYLTPATSGARL